MGGGPTLEDVRAFWERYPLYAGESAFEPGSRAFFEAHQAMTLREHGGRLHPILFRGLAPGARVLDVGCGNGFWTVQFARRGFAVSACDLTGRAVELTRRRLALEGLTAEVREGNAEALPYPASAFDHVNCQGVVHHTPNPGRCLAEFARVLGPGGTACWSVYYRVLALRSRWAFSLLRRSAAHVMRSPGRGRESLFAARDPEDFVRRYDGAENPIGVAFTRAEILALARPHFEVLEMVRIGFPRKVLPVSLPDALHRALSRWFGLMLVLRGRRRAEGVA
jgi:SAM-dependent methyltransferase